jgi:uncharacterized protein (TIGR02996 family)
MEQAALLAAIAAHPEEDTPRLAYADWLDEHAGDTPDPAAARVRAEFIRVQCELKKYEHLPSSQQQGYAGLYRRQNEILTHHRRDLLGRLGEELTEVAMTRDVVFDRGFLKKLTLDSGLFLKHASPITRFQPLPEVTVVEPAWWRSRLFASPDVDVITSLQLSPDEPFPEDLVPATLPLLLTESAGWQRLRDLSIEGCWITDEGLGILSRARNLPALTDLNLSSNEISDQGVRLLVASPPWPRLRHLVLDYNPISDEGAFALADAPPTAIRFLNVRGTAIGNAGRQRLLRRKGWNVALF